MDDEIESTQQSQVLGQDEGELDALPPSVQRNAELIDSYTYHSENSKNVDSSIEYVLGVDEAGRGPVLGPQVYGIAYCDITYQEDLRKIGFADSKTLASAKRSELLEAITANDHIKWAARVMSPHDISRGMLRKTPYNLNAQSHDATIQLIRDVVDMGHKVKECYVDTVGIASAYEKKLSGFFPDIKFTVASKADAKYPIVSAASIVAKVTRDSLMENWTFSENTLDLSHTLGSGYPGDPNTIDWLQKNLDPVFGYPNVVRFSWQTIKTLLDKKGAKVEWSDEPRSIQKFMKEKDPNTIEAPVFSDLGLHSVSSL